ncbi:hypothetical protein ACL02T_32860 [Pseudonocardia sp. RS010]|uniref:hypothetical protein n=1 Tax=Pseudonocardia sp. RS010 TaxID=3385979 RepID=UPI00399F9369
MAFTEITLTRDYRLAQAATEITGLKVRLTPSAAMTNTGDTVLPIAVEATVGADGELPIAVAANTDPDTTPADTSYTVREYVPGTGYSRTYSVVVPHDAASATADLATLEAAGA